jgi:TonB family protein
MLEQFIESKSTESGNNHRRNLLFSTFSLLTLMCFSAVLWSLFARNLDLGNGDLDIASIVSPVNIAATEVVKEVIKKNNVKADNSLKPQEVSRKVNMLRVEDNLEAPKSISTTQNTEMSRPKSGKYIYSSIDSGNGNVSDTTDTTGVRGNGQLRNSSTGGISSVKKDNEEEEIPVFEKKPKVEKVEKKPTKISLGVANGIAKSLPKPNFSAAAKAVGASGLVVVQITIDENGNVTSANATSGHPLLRAESERAARLAKFSPTLLSHQAVKATGILTYNFIK